MEDHAARISDALERRDYDALAAIEAIEHEDESRTGDRKILFGARYAMALVPGCDAALRTVDVLVRRRLFEHAASSTVRMKNGATLHADWAARYYGGVLAFTHVAEAPAIVEAMVSRWGETSTALRDLYACFLHECVLRGAELGACAAAKNIAAGLAASGHVLGALPLERLALEQGTEKIASTYGVRVGGGWHADAPVPGAEFERPLAGGGTRMRADEMTSRSDAKISAVFESHALVSNGKSEGRVFALEPPVVAGRAPDAALLRAVANTGRLDCLDGIDASEESLTVEALTATRAYRILLAFASNGGDYNWAWSAAYGREATWRSLAGLVDARASSSLAEIESLAMRCRFAWFQAKTAWFYRVVTDLGLVALRPDGASIALLGGTDTD